MLIDFMINLILFFMTIVVTNPVQNAHLISYYAEKALDK